MESNSLPFPPDILDSNEAPGPPPDRLLFPLLPARREFELPEVGVDDDDDDDVPESRLKSEFAEVVDEPEAAPLDSWRSCFHEVTVSGFSRRDSRCPVGS